MKFSILTITLLICNKQKFMLYKYKKGIICLFIYCLCSSVISMLSITGSN